MTGGKPTKRGHNQPIVSCLECRRMKWKCDRQFPCLNCRKRNLSDLCPHGQLQPAKVRQEQVAIETSSLLRRVKSLEQQLEVAQQKLKDGRAASLVEQRASPRLEADAEECTVGQLILGDEPGTSTFFGSAGAQYLFMPAPSGTTGKSDMLTFPAEKGVTSLQNLKTYLPARWEACRWAAIYFDDAAVMNHIIEPNDFYASYLNKVYDSDQFNNQHLALVFLILANGCAMDLELPPYNDTAERLFRFGRESVSIDSSSSVIFVQVINLISRYLANSFKGPKTSEQFWTTLGMGVRCAQSLGLHRDGKKWQLEPNELELRRRVFWEIYTEDILQSMTQGRPRLIADSTIDCVFPAKGNDGSRLIFHHYKYRLVRILASVNDLQTCVIAAPYQRVLDVHGALRTFENDLPVELQSPNDHKLQWQHLIMRLLINEGYLFLHRSHFARALRDFSDEPLASPFRYSYVIELEASRVVLVILRDILALHEQLAYRFWIFSFHAITAMVNFAAVVVRSPTSSLALAALNQVEIGMEIFEKVPEGSRARNDLPFLRNLLSRARTAVGSYNGSDGQRDEDILGMGTKLVRVSPRVSPLLPLPTTLADAVADTIEMGNGIGGGEDSHETIPWPTPNANWSVDAEVVTDDCLESQFDLDSFMMSIGLDVDAL